MRAHGRMLQTHYHLRSATGLISMRFRAAACGGSDFAMPIRIAARRDFTGYWEYLLEDAIFTAPPYPNFGGAALLNQNGELVGIGSLLVADAEEPGTYGPGNMFIPINDFKAIESELSGVRPDAAAEPSLARPQYRRGARPAVRPTRRQGRAIRRRRYQYRGHRCQRRRYPGTNPKGALSEDLVLWRTRRADPAYHPDGERRHTHRRGAFDRPLRLAPTAEGELKRCSAAGADNLTRTQDDAAVGVHDVALMDDSDQLHAFVVLHDRHMILAARLHQPERLS